MIFRLVFVTAVLLPLTLLVSLAPVPSNQDPGQANPENYIKQSEAAWAEAGSKGDTATIERILADDFVGVAPDGSSYDKAKEVADTKNDHGNTISNHVNKVTVRFFGDTAVAQGSETWEHREGKPKHGTYVWIDTWIRRNNNWQIVAAEDLLLPEPATK